MKRFLPGAGSSARAHAEPQEAPKPTVPPLVPEPNDKDAAFILLELDAV